jgi:integrase
MSTSKRIPSYRRHKQSGQAIVTLPDGLGGRRDFLLGEYGSERSQLEYARLLAQWETNGRRAAWRSSATDLTVNELILAYWKVVEEYYRQPDGTPTSEVNNIRLALRPLRELYGHTLAAEFDSLALEAVRDGKIQMGHCRSRINKDISRIKRLFQWGASRKLIPLSVFQLLQTVRGLRHNRSLATETEPVKPVSQEVVNATLPFLPAPVAAMAQLQLLTGMRPGEVVVMRGIDIDMTGPIWFYRPGSDCGSFGQHKTAWRGHHRVIALGPRAQEIVRLHLKTDLHACLFSPADSIALFRAKQRKSRKSKVQPSQVSRKKRNPKRRPGQKYTVGSYDHAVAAACIRAYPLPEPLARSEKESAHEWRTRLTVDQIAAIRQWRREHSWHPNQLRHTKATEIRREAGLDAARVVLGHRSPQITETYAEIDLDKAAEVMARLG